MSYNPGANSLTSVPNVLLLPTTTTPGTPPASGFELLYFKTSDGNLYKLNSSNVETMIGGGGGSGVSSLNSLTGALTLVAGSGISITPSGSNITIAATGSGANTALSNLVATSINQSLVAGTTGLNLGSAGVAWNNLFLASFASFVQIATPSNPASGSDLLYFKSGDGLYMLNSTGTESLVAGVGGNANRTLSNLTSPTAINEHLIAVTNGNYSLGSSAIGWENLFLTSFVSLGQIPTPGSNPPPGFDYIYFKNDDFMYRLDSAGIEHQFALDPPPGGPQWSVQSNNGDVGFYGDANFLYDGTIVTLNKVITWGAQSTPGTNPIAGYFDLYFKSDGNLYSLNSSGIETQIGGGGGGGVTSLNSLTGAVTIVAGSNITVTPSGSNITIASTASSTPGGTNSQIQYNNSGAFAGATFATDGNNLLFPQGNSSSIGTPDSGTFAQVVIQDITYVAFYPGAVYNNYSIEYLDGTPAGSEFVTVQTYSPGYRFTVHMQDGVSTDEQIATAWGNNVLASAIIAANDDGSGNPQNATGGFISLTGGVDDTQGPSGINTNQLSIWEGEVGSNGNALFISSASTNGAQILLQSISYGGIPWVIASHAINSGLGPTDPNAGSLQFVNANPNAGFVHTQLNQDGTIVTGGLTAHGDSVIDGSLSVTGSFSYGGELTVPEDISFSAGHTHQFGEPYGAYASATFGQNGVPTSFYTLTFTSLVAGPFGNGISFYVFGGGTQGSEVIALSGLQISAQVQLGASTLNDVYVALQNYGGPSLPVSFTFTFGSGPAPINNPFSVQLTGGDMNLGPTLSYFDGPVNIQTGIPSNFVTLQDITYYNIIPGVLNSNGDNFPGGANQPPPVTITYSSVAGSAITISSSTGAINVQIGTSANATATNIVAAIVADAGSMSQINPVITGTASAIQSPTLNGTTGGANPGTLLSITSDDVNGVGIKFTNTVYGYLDLTTQFRSATTISANIILQSVGNINTSYTGNFPVFFLTAPIGGNADTGIGLPNFMGNITFSDYNNTTPYFTLNTESVSSGSMVLYDNGLAYSGNLNPSSGPSVDFGNRILYDSNASPSNAPALDWINRQLISGDGSTITADWGGGSPFQAPRAFSAINSFIIAGHYQPEGNGINYVENFVQFNVSPSTTNYVLNLPEQQATFGSATQSLLFNDNSGNLTWSAGFPCDIIFSATNTYSLGSVLTAPAPIVMVFNPGPSEGTLTWTPVNPGAFNNQISIQFIEPGSAPFGVVEVSGYTITIRGNAGGNTSTLSQIQTWWNANSSATALATISLTGNGAFHPSPFGPTYFTGGFDQISASYVYSNAYAVGNSSPASVGPGGITAKYPIYDLSNNLLGYVPIYSSIT